jgi:hypothetical protein
MYLMKQWRESRIVSAVGLLGLVLLAVLIFKGIMKADSASMHPGNHNNFAQFFIPTFYVQAVLISGWAWLLAGIGAGKNLGEESGSFLFTRPRTRAWFLWHDWGFGMALIAVVTLLSDLMFSVLCARLLRDMHLPSAIQFSDGNSIAWGSMMALIGVGVLLCAGLLYSLTYLTTIVVKRSSGVILGAAVFAGYLVLRALIAHYYPAVQLPAPALKLFNLHQHIFHGLSNHLALWISVRALFVLLFPAAALLVLNRAEI